MLNAISVAFSFAGGQSQRFASFLSLSSSLCASLPPFLSTFFSLSVFWFVCLSLCPCLSVFLVSLHKFVSSQKCGEIVVSLCVCPSARTTLLPPMSLWVALGARRRRLWARLDLCALCALAQKCDAMHCKCPGQPSAPAVHRPPSSLLPHSHTHTHTHTLTHSLACCLYDKTQSMLIYCC